MEAVGSVPRSRAVGWGGGTEPPPGDRARAHILRAPRCSPASGSEDNDTGFPVGEDEVRSRSGEGTENSRVVAALELRE